jgi:hypothetical protein
MQHFSVQVLKFLGGGLVKGNRSILLTTMSLVIFAATAAVANAGELLSAEVMKPAPAELAGAFERSTGHKFTSGRGNKSAPCPLLG